MYIYLCIPQSRISTEMFISYFHRFMSLICRVSSFNFLNISSIILFFRFSFWLFVLFTPTFGTRRKTSAMSQNRNSCQNKEQSASRRADVVDEVSRQNRRDSNRDEKKRRKQKEERKSFQPFGLALLVAKPTFSSCSFVFVFWLWRNQCARSTWLARTTIKANCSRSPVFGSVWSELRQPSVSCLVLAHCHLLFAICHLPRCSLLGVTSNTIEKQLKKVPLSLWISIDTP